MNYLDIPETKPVTRADMIAYLKNHFRYDTMNSWNASTSYANCIKITHLNGLTKEDRDACFDMLEVDEAFDDMRFMMQDFERMQDHRWGMGTNGRSGGYIVLYSGGVNDKGNKCIYPGKGVDMGEDFDSWDDESLMDRVETVWEFDQSCESIVAQFVEFARSHRVVEKEVMIPKTVKVAEERA